MTPAEAIASLPGDVRVSVTIGGAGPTVDELRAAFASDGPVMISTTEASARYGWSREYWAGVAPTLDGAVKGREWHLPIEAVEAHLRAKSTKPSGRRRAPAPSSSSRARPQGLQAR